MIIMGKKRRIRYSSEYIAHVESGESAAVFVARDIATEINTEGKWIDILFHDGYRINSNVWNFKKIIIELYPRKTNPVYPKGLSDEDKKYITWQTAHNDIEKLRSKGYYGPKYELTVKLDWKYSVLSKRRI